MFKRGTCQNLEGNKFICESKAGYKGQYCEEKSCSRLLSLMAVSSRKKNELFRGITYMAPVVKGVDNFTRWISRYPTEQFYFKIGPDFCKATHLIKLYQYLMKHTRHDNKQQGNGHQVKCFDSNNNKNGLHFS